MDYQNPAVTYGPSEDLGTSAVVASFFGAYLLAVLAVSLVALVGEWKVYQKAGKPGWAVIVPFYNMYILNKIVGRPDWFFWAALASLLLMIIWIPAFYVFWLIWCLDLAKAFGRSAVFGVFGLFFFPFVGFPMLGFGKDMYVGPSVAAKPAETPVPPTPPAAPTPPAV